MRTGARQRLEVERLRRHNHLQILGAGLALYIGDLILSWRGVWGYGGDVGARLVFVGLGLLLIMRMQVRRSVARRWELWSFAALTLGLLAHAILAVRAEALSADTLLSSGLWLYLIYVYAFYVLSAPGAWRLTLATWSAFTATGIGLVAGGDVGVDGLAAFAQFQGGGIVAIVLASALSGWQRALDEASHRVEDAERESLTDALTGQPNRRALQLMIHREVARTRRSGTAFSVLLLDVDGFKGLNDVHGHPVGDSILMEIAAVLRARLRTEDELGRWGGEEFMVVAPATSADAGLQLAERLREALEAHAWSVGQVTASFGVAGSRRGDGLEHLFKRADDALYRAKQLGRNRCELELAPVADAGADADGGTDGGADRGRGRDRLGRDP